MWGNLRPTISTAQVNAYFANKAWVNMDKSMSIRIYIP